MVEAGWARRVIDITPQGHAMHGYGQPQHRATGVRSPLHARTVVMKEVLKEAATPQAGKALVFCCLDLGYVTHAMRAESVSRLQTALGAGFDEACFVLTCTHTHSGPGGCSHDVLYNLVTPGFQPGHLAAVVEAIVASVQEAWQSAAPAALSLSTGAFADTIPVAWNRSLAAWNRNPEVTRHVEQDCHLAMDREMQVLTITRDGQPRALISLFGVHATCLGNTLNRHDGDNKGYAALQTEAALGGEGAVAIFAQGTAGDISPHYHGPGQQARRDAIQGEEEYRYAEANGSHQSRLALALAAAPQPLTLDGPIDGVLTYVDFTAVQADPVFAGGKPDARTTEPCHGLSFFAGTPVDGHGMPPPLLPPLRLATRALKAWRLGRFSSDREHYRQLYRAQGPKDILIESGRKLALGRPLTRLGLPDAVDPLVAEINRQAAAGAMTRSALVPTVLPLQIVRLGPLAVVCCPGEFTTTAGQRLREVVRQSLAGTSITQVLICTYCNDYMGYVTTFEEYQEQAYEGGHTVFGQWTLAAFQTRFRALADTFAQPPAERRHDTRLRPTPAPADELALRSGLPAAGHSVRHS